MPIESVGERAESRSSSRASVEELKKLPEFKLLPENQQKFLAAYIASGYDAKAAVEASYPKARTPESVRVMGSRILHSPGMVMLLQMHYGNSPQESFCQMVAGMVLRGRISKEQVAMVRLLAQVRKFVDPWAPRYEKTIEQGLANNREAVKKRVQRAARRQAIEKAATKSGSSLLSDFETL